MIKRAFGYGIQRIALLICARFQRPNYLQLVQYRNEADFRVLRAGGMLNLITIFVLTAVAFGLVISLMAVGVMLGRREIQGSCGGVGSSRGEAGSTPCSLCSNPDAACRELGRGVQDSDGEARVDEETVDCDQQCEANGCSDEEIEACNRQ